MKCEACTEGNHMNCGMQTWCDCDCAGYSTDCAYADAEIMGGEQMVLVCGYEGCCMPGYHLPSECHNADDMEAYYAECEAQSQESA